MLALADAVTVASPELTKQMPVAFDVTEIVVPRGVGSATRWEDADPEMLTVAARIRM